MLMLSQVIFLSMIVFMFEFGLNLVVMSLLKAAGWGSQAGCKISPPNDVMLGKLIEYGYYWDKLISIENIISPAIFITIAFRYLYLVNVDIYILMSKYVVCYKVSKALSIKIYYIENFRNFLIKINMFTD